jgi:hypothetical protein
MVALVAFVWDAMRALFASLGFSRAVLGGAACVAIAVFYAPAKQQLALKGFDSLPDVPGGWIAFVFGSLFVVWNLLRYAVVLQRGAKPVLSLKILDPGERYETYVVLGNRLLRLYHVEVENASRSKPARRTTVSLETYQMAGDKRMVDIRSKLKVANSEAEEIDLKPRGRVIFELCGVEAVEVKAETASAEERDGQTFSIVPSGSGTIRLLAEADNAPAVEEHYMLYVDSRGVMTIKPQAAA